MAGLNPIMLFLLLGKGLGGGLIKKVLFYSMFGMVGLFLGGGFSIRDFILVPAIAPMFSGMMTGGA